MIRSAASSVPLTVDRARQKTLVSVVGELDFIDAPAFERSLLDIVGEGRPTVEVDLSQLSFLSVAALDALLRVKHTAQQAGCQFRVVNPSAAVRRLLTISGTCALLTGSTEAETSWPVHRAPKGEVSVG